MCLFIPSKSLLGAVRLATMDRFLNHHIRPIMHTFSFVYGCAMANTLSTHVFCLNMKLFAISDISQDISIGGGLEGWVRRTTVLAFRCLCNLLINPVFSFDPPLHIYMVVSPNLIWCWVYCRKRRFQNNISKRRMLYLNVPTQLIFNDREKTWNFTNPNWDITLKSK